MFKQSCFETAHIRLLSHAESAATHAKAFNTKNVSPFAVFVDDQFEFVAQNMGTVLESQFRVVNDKGRMSEVSLEQFLQTQYSSSLEYVQIERSCGRVVTKMALVAIVWSTDETTAENDVCKAYEGDFAIKH